MNVLDQFRLDGKIALVTGCRRGIGKALAIALAEAGADIIGVSASLEAKGSDVEREVEGCGRKFNGYACDFSDRKALYGFVQGMKSDCPDIDILVNNAGVVLRERAVAYTDEFWDRTMEINLSSHFVLSREIGQEMVKRGSGKIIFIASILSFQGGINVPAYAAAKGGIGQLTKALANEWAGAGVQVNAIAPGYIATDSTEALSSDAVRNSAILSRIPTGRWGTPEDLKGVVVFLASTASDYVNGTVLTVDGGWMAR